MKLYKTCDTLPLKNFLKVIEDNNYKWLVITDNYDFKLKRDLSELWESLLKEYAEIGGDKTIIDRFEAFKELHQLIVTYKIISAMIYTLYYKYNRQYVEDLAMFGYNVEIVNNLIQVKSLQRCSQQSKEILNDIESLKKTLEPDNKKKQGNLFYMAIAPLIEGYGNLEDDITVAKYVSLKNHLIKIHGRDKRK